MKKILPACFRSLIVSVALLLMHSGAFASHLVGCDLFYTWITGNQYKVTVILYGNCGSASSAAFSTLNYASPQVCIYDGNTYWSSINLVVQAPSAGVEITPVCPADSLLTQCHVPSSTIPGITKFVYTYTVTLPHTSRAWRFLYNAYNGTASASGRAAAITNLSAPGSTLMQLIDTLNNADLGVYSHNTSPLLTVVPTPFFCLNNIDCYNPGALDPDGDSLRFSLTAATNGSGSNNGCTVGGACTYAGTAWPGQPITPTTPLQCTAASFLFDQSTGQICFFPNFTQRSVVVYNIQEYRNDTFVGSCQREMTFVVLTCTNSAPTSALGSLSGLIFDDTTHYHVCGNIGPFCMTYASTEPDTANHITITVTGLTSGMTYTVTANNTNHPTVNVCGNTTLMTPGLYTFYLHMQDDNCPLTGVNTQAYSVNIYPVPTVRDSIAFPATCLGKAVVYIIPGGTGKPWTIDVFHGPADTFQTFIDSVMFIDSLGPTVGTLPDSISIFTNVSHECGATIPIVITPPPPILPTVIPYNPTFCGANDGYVSIHSLLVGSTADTVKYIYNGIHYVDTATVHGDSIVIGGLLAGTVDSIIVIYGYCASNPLGPYTLVNPPFTMRALSFTDPTKCGVCDGNIYVYGLHPTQRDTLKYTLNGVAQTWSQLIGADSMMQLFFKCAGTYANFYVQTDSGRCLAGPLGPLTLVAPPITIGFDTVLKYGCHGDTLHFTNLSIPTTGLNYSWSFGDGYFDTAANPVHIYTNTATDSLFSITLIINNGTGQPQCADTLTKMRILDNFISAGFSLLPYPIVCQHLPVAFTNLSTGTFQPKYLWSFGDGVTSTGITPVHIYTNTGTYNIMLRAANFVPCYDTAYSSIIVDSISGISMNVTDSVLCRGHEVTMTANYTHIGDTENVWSITSGSNYGIINVNPLQYSFDGAGVYTVSVTAKFRACPETTATRTIAVYGYPTLYLGPDTTICPGSTSVVLSDYTSNYTTAGAQWQWSTGETTPNITVTKPGYYSAVVTLDGCQSSDTVWVQNDCYMDIPNVFTPNGDGVNDYFFPRQFLTRGVITFSMNIYNRWGQLIYQTTSTDGRGWDGAFNNTPQPEAVYVYVIDAVFKDGQKEHHQGNVTLLR